MITLGIIIMVIGLLFPIYWFIFHDKFYKTIIFFSSIVMLVGLALLFNENITEFTINGVGTIKTAVEQAQTDAQEIADIKERIWNQSATIDIVSDRALKAEVDLDLLDSTINMANIKIGEVDEISNFSLLLLAAQNDNRLAFDSLRFLSEDKIFPFQALAFQAYMDIMNNHFAQNPEYNQYIPWDDDIDPKQLTMDELYEVYYRTYDSARPALIEYIWKRTDIPKIDRMDFLIYVMENDISLKAVEFAGRNFSKESNKNYYYLATYRFIDWWEENREIYLEKAR